MFGLNDIFKYIEKHQQSQRQDWADTLSEIVLEGKERTRIEKLEDLLSVEMKKENQEIKKETQEMIKEIKKETDKKYESVA